MQQPIPVNQIGRAQQHGSTQPSLALFNLGFRPFFLGAAIFSILSLTVWMLVYQHGFPLALQHISAMQWHAHEMLYGYALAVIAGFLLTAVKNWTGVQTLHGKPLLGLFLLWLLARVCMIVAPHYMLLSALFDMLFGVALAAAVAAPIVKVKQWRQLGVLAKIFLLTLGNMMFYVSALGGWDGGAQFSITLALYLIISLIFMIGRRVVPMFIERGVAEQVVLKQHKWLDLSIMALLVLLLLNALIFDHPWVAFCLGLGLFLANALRLLNWHTKGLWQVPLLWSLYLGLWLMTLGFLVLALSAVVSDISKILAIHLWAVGGVGLMTVAMMARVSLGHTGRNIKAPPSMMRYSFALLVLSAVFRAVLPLFFSAQYALWVELSFLCWLVALGIFIVNYFTMLIKSRIDGQFG